MWAVHWWCCQTLTTSQSAPPSKPWASLNSWVRRWTKQMSLICFIFPGDPRCNFSRWPLVQVWKTCWRQIALLTVSRFSSSSKVTTKHLTISLPPSCWLCLCFILVFTLLESLHSNAALADFVQHLIFRRIIEQGWPASRRPQQWSLSAPWWWTTLKTLTLLPSRCRGEDTFWPIPQVHYPSFDFIQTVQHATVRKRWNGGRSERNWFSRVLPHFWGQSEET